MCAYVRMRTIVLQRGVMRMRIGLVTRGLAPRVERECYAVEPLRSSYESIEKNFLYALKNILHWIVCHLTSPELITNPIKTQLLKTAFVNKK